MKRNSYLIVATKRLKVVEKTKGGWIPNPLEGLPIRYHPYVIHRDDRVKEGDETFFMMGLSEPRCVVEKTEWCSVIRKKRN